MTYFADLTAYSFLRGSPDKQELNVGWLTRWHKFQKGPVPESVLAKIFQLCRTPMNKTRGFHSCEFCHGRKFGQVVERDGVQLRLGSAEIRVPGVPGVEYACPDMIYHYMAEHAYKPPDEFIDAALNLPF
jgi:hypothetical protein